MKTIILTVLLLISCIAAGCHSGQNFDDRLNDIAGPYLFSIAGWEAQAIPQEISRWIAGDGEVEEYSARRVVDYFDYVGRIKALKSEIGTAETGDNQADTSALWDELDELEEKRASLEGTVEEILERQIREVLAEQGIFNPAGGEESTFPPVNFRLEQLPSVLVVSPRDRIESIREYTLESGLTREQKESIEYRVDKLGVSSLVTEIGGIATYPSLVDSRTSLRSAIETVAEEWLHQYLFFTPLGFRYALDLAGISRDYEIATMNETLADMVSDEIGSIVYEKYYAGYESGAGTATERTLDFNAEMRTIRQVVDGYLAAGEIEAAEVYMEEKRQFLASEGYYIRKLNQAYFAFHGAYAARPAFKNPIGLELEELRSRSGSLKEFLDAAAGMTGRQDLQASLRQE